MIRLLIVDDHHVVRKGLEALLSSEKYGIEVVGEASDGDQAVALALDLQPDVILMDLQMPKKSGLEAIRILRDYDLESNILVLTSFGEDDCVSAAMQAGALGYLLKDSSPDELVNAIHAVALGHISIPRELSGSIIGIPNGINPTSAELPGINLTEREKDVLQQIAQGASNKEIASRLSISQTTVRTHVSNILRKLNLENRTQAALFARNHDLSG
jgi:DNA-binding NarL/FixJ family response regulator